MDSGSSEENGVRERLKSLVKACMDAAASLRFFPGSVRVVTHYDADGIASAAILTKALLREEKRFHLSIAKQLSSELIEELGREAYGMIVFADLGSGMLEEIDKKLLSAGKRVIVIDHHERQGVINEERMSLIHHINPLEFGISEDISGSGMSYIFARSMNPENRDLAFLGILGAIGDSQTGSIREHWGVLGLNQEILKDAISSGRMKVSRGLRLWGRNTRPIHKALEYSMDPYIPGVSGSESASVQFLQELGIELRNSHGWRTLSDLSDEEKKKLSSAIIAERAMNGEENPEWIFGDVYDIPFMSGELSDASEFATILNACGKTGNPWKGVGMCLGDVRCVDEADDVLTEYRREIGRALAWVNRNRECIRESEHAVCLIAGSNISEHLISNVISVMHRSGMLPDKPAFAFADTEDGNIKVSARISDRLLEKGLDLKEIVTRIVEKTGGEGGGHAGASGATIPKESLELFISEAESILEKRKSGKTGTQENNLNTSQQEKIVISGSGEDGSAESEGPGEGEIERREAEERRGQEGREETDNTEMERKGLVRYFLS